MDFEKAIRRGLEWYVREVKLADVRRKRGEFACTLGALGYEYACKEEFLLRHGRVWQPQPRPRGYRRGAVRMCFSNARRVMLRYGLRYVEGVTAEYGFPMIHHAWCVDGQDRVIEVTWPEPAAAYFGVVIPPKYVQRAAKAHGNGALDDWENRWPILRVPFKEGRAPRRTNDA